MAQTKYLDATGVGLIKDDYTGKLAKKVDTVAGKSLVSDTEITKLEGIEEGAQKNNITKVTVNGTDQTIADGTLTIDVESVFEGDGFVKNEALTTTLGDYLKKDEVDTTLTDYAKSSEVAETYATKTEMTNLGTIVGTCEFADLEDKKAETGTGDCWVVTDKSNHIYYYNGTDFVDCGGDVDLTGYLKSTVAESTYAKITDLDNKVNTTDLVALTEEEVKTALGIVE